MNPHKRNFFCSGMDDDIIRRVQHLSGFIMGSLSVRYLGVPLSYKKLIIA